jgi:hypothetical protein
VFRAPAASRRLDAPAPLRLWHLASLDAPTVAVVWSLGFAWAAKVSLPAWIPVLLALAAWSAYIADRLLDARAALRNGNLQSLRQRHWFHHRHRRLLGPLAIASAFAAAFIVISVMPVAARERNSVLGVAALVYFTRVHTSRRLAGDGFSRAGFFSLAPFFNKEFFVGVLFTSACALPAVSRVAKQAGAPFWPLLATTGFFAALAWLNCHAIECWETEPAQQDREVCFSGAKEVAEKGLRSSENPQKHASGAEAQADSIGFSPGINPRPTARLSFSAACKAPGVSARFVRGFKPPPPSGSSATEACVLAVMGLMLACVLSHSQPRSAALVAAGAVSAGLLAFLDRSRGHLTPLALRVAADLVLLTPLALVVR